MCVSVCMAWKVCRLVSNIRRVWKTPKKPYSAYVGDTNGACTHQAVMGWWHENCWFYFLIEEVQVERIRTNRSQLVVVVVVVSSSKLTSRQWQCKSPILQLTFIHEFISISWRDSPISSITDSSGAMNPFSNTENQINRNLRINIETDLFH